MNLPMAAVIKPGAPTWPQALSARLGDSAPSEIHLIGPAPILAERKIALFCSARTPGAAILRTHDAARRIRDEGTTVISGFHSPIEKACLKILLRGRQLIIICPGRSIESMRIPTDCRTAFEAGRILFLSPFTDQIRRVTKESAYRRNEVVAALADEAYIAHVEGGGKTEQIVKKLTEWKVPIL